MKQKDLHVTLFGIAAGVLLGVGSIGWTQMHATTVTLLSDDVHPAALSDVYYNKRTVNRLGVPFRDNSGVRVYPTVKPDTAQSSSVSSEAAVPEACAAVKKAVWKIKSVYTMVTPVNVSNTALRQKMDVVFAEAVRDVCPEIAAVSSSSAAAVESSIKVNNHCENYPIHTARYKQCVIAGEQGNKYP